MTRPDPFLTRLNWPIFYLSPFWPTTRLTQPNPPVCHVSYLLTIKSNFFFKIPHCHSFLPFRVYLLTVFFPLFSVLKNNFFIFETKKLVWQPKIDIKQKLFSKLNLWKKLKTCKMLFLVFNFQNLMKIHI